MFALRKHIVETNKQSKRRFEVLIKQILEKISIDENLKNTAHLKWTEPMNNYKHSLEEIILNELIFFLIKKQGITLFLVCVICYCKQGIYCFATSIPFSIEVA